MNKDIIKNKNVILLLVVVAMVAGGFLYRTVFLKDEICRPEHGEDVELNVIAKEGIWRFDPDNISVNKCDKITLNIFNEDDYDHGIAIDVFGINKRLSPKSTTIVKFTASKDGEFLFYCSVPCGEGHFDHKGLIQVRDVDYSGERKTLDI